MKKRKTRDPSEYIEQLDINGLQGRMLKLPSSSQLGKREILMVYGSHASIERMFSLADEFSMYGEVTIPDLPGFGGMDSYYKLQKKPTIDTMADYLASFIKMRYKSRRFTVVGVSYGFTVVTRMLQKYPSIARKVDIVVSLAGFAHHDDFSVSRSHFLLMKYGSYVLSSRPLSWVVGQCTRAPFIASIYRLQASRHSKLKDASDELREKRIDFEVTLWQVNDMRTYFYTAYTMFALDLCTRSRIDLDVYHIAVRGDHFFNNSLVEQHLGVIYSDVHTLHVKLDTHMPTVVASAKDVAPFVPSRLRKLLATT